MIDDAARVDPTDAAWFLAYSLDERLTGGDPPGPVDEDLGRIRLKMWKDEPVHVRQPDRMAAHLARHGLDESRLRRLLGERPETVRARFDTGPPYVRRLAEAWERSGDTTTDGYDDGTGFAVVAAPLVAAAVGRRRERVADLAGAHPHLSAEVLTGQLGPGPLDAINHLTARTLVLELNVLRLRGELAGDGPRERYHHFLHRLREPAYALGVLREYPVLARDLVRTVDNWEASRLEFAQRLVADHAELAHRSARSGWARRCCCCGSGRTRSSRDRCRWGPMLALNALAAAVLTPLMGLINATRQLQTVGTHLERIRDVMGETAEQDRSKVSASGRISGHVALTGVGMRYSANAGWAVRGGQRQRLALARALVHNPPLQLLDEATSHLDVVTERRVDEVLSALSCTRIVIAHRLSTVVNADLIGVMEDGRLVEQGTHEELIAHHGRYEALVRDQIQTAQPR